jgi:replicative DNA helicase
LVPVDLIGQAKNSIGTRAAEIISSGLGVVNWDERHLKGCCPYHAEKTPSFIWNKKGNYFKCFGCGVTVDIIDYYQQQGMNFIEAVKELFRETGTRYDFDDGDKPVFNKDRQPYRYPKAEHDLTSKQTIEYLALRKISLQAAIYAGIKQDGTGQNLAFEYRDENGKLMLTKYRPARKIEKGDLKSWCQKDKDTVPLLYGMDKADPTKPLLICEGELDRAAAIEAGFYNTVSVPFGANNYHWIEHNWDWLEQFQKLIIWSDNDQAGEEMRKEVVPRLGEYRCYVVRGGEKDINETLFKRGRQEVLRLIEKAEDIPIRDVIDMAEVEDYDISQAEKIKSGINGLDKWIGGFFLGTVNVITGINGSGKSTFIDQVCVCEALEQGYKTFIFSGELTKQQLRNWIEYPMAGPENVSIKDNGINQPPGYWVSKKTKDKMRHWYRGKIFIYDNDLDYTAKSILRKMEELARKHGVKNFVLDNLMMIDLECNEFEKYTKQKDFVLELIRFAQRFNAVVHLVAHPRKVEAIRRLSKLDVCGSGDITNLAHYVTSIHRVTPAEQEDKHNKQGVVIEPGCPFDCIIDLFKNRPIGYQDKSVGVYFEPKSKRFYGDSDDKDKKYGWEHQPVNLGGIQGQIVWEGDYEQVDGL